MVVALLILASNGCGHETTQLKVTSPPARGDLAAELLKVELDTRILRQPADAPELRHYTARLNALDALLAHIERTAGFLAAGKLRAAEVGIQLAGITYDLMLVDFEATIRHVGGSTRRECNQGIAWTGVGIQGLAKDASWADRIDEVQQALQAAAWHRDNVMKAAPVANVMKVGVTSATITNSAVSALMLARSGLAALVRLSRWMEQGGASFGVLQAAPAGGGTIQLVTSSGVLVLAPAEVTALVSVGQLSATAASLYMMARGEHRPATPEAEESLPSTTEASVIEKLERYLLNPEHPVGRSKVQWFKEALGFQRENAPALAVQIKFDPSKAIVTEVTPHGGKLNQVITIAGANGKMIDVLFVWIRNNDGVVRLVSAIPTKK